MVHTGMSNPAATIIVFRLTALSNGMGCRSGSQLEKTWLPCMRAALAVRQASAELNVITVGASVGRRSMWTAWLPLHLMRSSWRQSGRDNANRQKLRRCDRDSSGTLGGDAADVFRRIG